MSPKKNDLFPSTSNAGRISSYNVWDVKGRIKWANKIWLYGRGMFTHMWCYLLAGQCYLYMIIYRLWVTCTGEFSSLKQHIPIQNLCPIKRG
jgi:hypothetical protein